jgi:hypothetical protein
MVNDDWVPLGRVYYLGIRGVFFTPRHMSHFNIYYLIARFSTVRDPFATVRTP